MERDLLNNACTVRSEGAISEQDKFLIQSVPLTDAESDHGMTSADVSENNWEKLIL